MFYYICDILPFHFKVSYMEFTIYFCADGILRAKFSDNKPMIPLKFLQEQNGKSDFQFWVAWWKNEVFFEEGLTVGKFLICLEPWTEFWSDMTNTNLKAYFSELRKPLIVNNQNNDPDIDDRIFDWVNIVYRSELEPTTEYLKEDEEIEDIQEWFNSPKTKRLTGKWRLQSSYVINGFHNGEAEHYSIDYTPMNELANVPIYLAKDHQIYLTDYDLKNILGSKQYLFKKDAFGVNTVTQKGFKNKKYQIKFLLEEKSHNLRDVLEGFFHWMYKEPATRDDFIESLKNIKDSLNEDFETSSFEEDSLDNIVTDLKEFKDSLNDSEEESFKETMGDFVNKLEEAPQDMNNVISLHGKNLSAEKENNEESADKLEIKVAPGAFSPLVEAFERDNDYWEAMISNASKDANVVLKIGKVQIAEQPENRIFNMIIDPNDTKANPIPSEYKTI